MEELKLAWKDAQGRKKTIVAVGSLRIGSDFVIMAGPCAVESEEQTLSIARKVKASGAHILRGGAFKPRTSPYSFQGLEEEGLEILKKAKEETGLPVISEVMDVRHIEAVSACADILQVGSRNMQNYTLLKELGKVKKPIMLKRGMNATLDDWLNSAEYLLAGGNPDVILCERGIRTFENSMRNTLDLSIIPAAKRISHLPVIVDPSHGTGRADLIEPMSLAAIAAGADGLLIEVHNQPSCALSDHEQQISPEAFERLVPKLKKIKHLMDEIQV
jgi:3-deoxy-7-phosphoheptulonate synthase